MKQDKPLRNLQDLFYDSQPEELPWSLGSETALGFRGPVLGFRGQFWGFGDVRCGGLGVWYGSESEAAKLYLLG